MQQALDLAASVRGGHLANPWVGAVVVRDGVVIARGATQPPGGLHAEAAALGEVDAQGATVYVTLEPCAPFEGKRTPPCSDALVAAGVGRVVVAMLDPDPRVGGRGVERLRAAGVEVDVGDGQEAAVALLRPWLKRQQTGRPYVIAKFAASLDGRTATHTGDSKWITGEEARDLAHRQRAWVDAILVGSGTVLADNPSLTARPAGALAERQPARVVVDARGRTPASARLFAGPGHVIVATTAASDPAWRKALGSLGAHVVECEPADGGVNLQQLMQALAQRAITSIWAEGGGTLLGSLFEEGLVDEVWAFLAPVIIGGTGLPAVGGPGVDFVADAWRLRDVTSERVGDDILVRGYAGDWSPALG
ncbi:MAG: bifunctional diaminohydroxyphosphoribosylaminopyrimidine deaminase/5-amino-6-(5-phosphoribosylamino)uracil reductase RibD [Dehalococcoidia bacterium]